MQARAAGGTDAVGKVTSTPSTAALASFVWAGCLWGLLCLFVFFICLLHFVWGFVVVGCGGLVFLLLFGVYFGCFVEPLETRSSSDLSPWI